MDRHKLTLYNPAELEKEDLIEGFVVRHKPFNTIMDEIKGQKPKSSLQHFLIIGQRGMGKTTLMYRIKYEIENDEKLNQNIIPVSFSEEQHNIVDLGDVWLSVARSLEQTHPELFADLLDEIEEHDAEADFSNIAYQLLIDSLKKHKKNLVLLVDNMGLLLESIKKAEAKRFREILMTEKRIRLIGASSYVLEHSFNYKDSFFEFFKQIRLEGLSPDETYEVLRNLGRIQHQEEKINHIIETQPQRIETIRRLTGGVIRTMVLLFEILADSENGKVLNDLEEVLDRVTPLYQHRMELLKSQQKQIVDVVARKWDAVSVRDIASEGRIVRQGIKSNQISAQLQQLVENQIIEEVDTGRRNKLYRIRERFFNIWYLMRSSRKLDRQRVIWLIRFFEAWCTKEQLMEMVHCQIDGYKKGNYTHSSAYLRALAVASVDGIEEQLKHELLEETVLFLEKTNKSLANAITKSFPRDFERIEAISNVYSYFNTKDLKQMKVLVEEELKEGKRTGALKLASLLVIKLNKINESIFYLKKAYEIDKDDITAHLLGLSFFKLKKFSLAEKYLKVSFNDFGNYRSAYLLGRIYEHHNKIEEAVKYYDIAFEHGIEKAAYELGVLYSTTIEVDNFDKAVEYLKIAVKYEKKERKAVAALILANIYVNSEEKNVEALNLTEIAYENGHPLAPMFLFNLYESNFEEPIEDRIVLAETSLYSGWALNVAFDENIVKMFTLLLAEKQYNFALKIFKDREKDSLIERFKPVYYATLYYLKDEYPVEYQKAGPELQETIQEIIEQVEEVRKDLKELRKARKEEKSKN